MNRKALPVAYKNSIILVKRSPILRAFKNTISSITTTFKIMCSNFLLQKFGHSNTEEGKFKN